MRILRNSLIALAAVVVATYLGCVAYAYYPRVETESLKFAEASDRFIAVNGHRIRYRDEAGPSAHGPSLILIHGYANNLRTFDRLVPELSGVSRIVRLDLPGFGLSDKPVDYDYSMKGQARTVVDFAKAVHLERYIVAGHSMGGGVALATAAASSACQGLWLMDSAVFDSGVPPFVAHLFFPLPRMSAWMFADQAFRRRMMEKTFTRPERLREEDVTQVLLATRTEGYAAAQTAMVEQYAEEDLSPLLAHVSVPTLLVWGEDDQTNPPSNARAVHAQLEGSTLAVIEDAGHYVHLEAPKAVAASAGAFFDAHFSAKARIQAEADPKADAPSSSPSGS